jgi:hypothetical protein
LLYLENIAANLRVFAAEWENELILCKSECIGDDSKWPVIARMQQKLGLVWCAQRT